VTEYSKLSDLIYIGENSLSEEFCNKCIKKFKKDPNKVEGRTGSGVLLDVKQSMDVNISSDPKWKEEDAVFYDSLHHHVEKYRSKYSDVFRCLLSSYYEDSGYQIQETLPGGFYKWHNDFYTKDGAARFLTYIWYLNTVDEGGETEFIDGTKIKPKTGNIMLFPSTWTYYHQGLPPIKQKKYICTGWIYLKSDVDY
jgi:Rps23 Pro-64 3,4-dihydroxylase Tpa1-like proline 4-hydroxylase